MLIEIFRYLSESDISQSVLYVCKRWLNVAKHLQCMTTRSFSFDNTLPLPSDSITIVENTDFKITSVDIKDFFSVLCWPSNLWTVIGKNANTIKFNRCREMDEHQMAMALEVFPSLRCLNFRFCFPKACHNYSTIDSNAKANEHLTNVKELNLKKNIWIDMSEVEELVKRMPSLEHFGLSCLAGITPVNDIMKVIKCRTKSIRSLSLRHCRTNNGTLLMENLTKLNGLTLERFTFSISWIAESVVRDFFAKHNKIKVLQLGTLVTFANVYFDFLLNLTDLSDLNIDIVDYQETFSILKRFFELPFLSNLILERDSDAENTKCIGMHKTFKIKKLQHLRLTFFNIDCKLCFEHFCESLINLQSLSISSSNITNEDLSLIFEHMPRLRSLDLSRCVRITDVAMLGLSQTSVSVKRKKTNNFSLKSLKGLKYLNLSGCTSLTDITFTQNYEMLDLRTLNVGCIPKLTSIGIIKLSQNFRTLESLQIYGNGNVDSHVLQIILKNLWRLKELDISKYSSEDACKPLTTHEIEAICKHSQKLKTLIMLQRKLRIMQIKYLFQHVSTLMSVNDETRDRMADRGEMCGEIMKEVPENGMMSLVEENFLKVLEQVRDKNTDFMTEPITLNSFLF